MLDIGASGFDNLYSQTNSRIPTLGYSYLLPFSVAYNACPVFAPAPAAVIELISSLALASTISYLVELIVSVFISVVSGIYWIQLLI